MKKVLCFVGISILLVGVSMAQFDPVTNLKDHDQDGTGILTSDVCDDAYKEYLYYAGVQGPRVYDTFTATSSLHRIFNQDASGEFASFVGERNPDNLVEFGTHQWWSNGKPIGVNSVVSIASPLNEFQISDQIPASYTRDQVASQLVYGLRRYSYVNSNDGFTESVRYVENQIPFPAQQAQLITHPFTSNSSDFSLECVNIHIGYCGDGIIDKMDGSAVPSGTEITGQDPFDFHLQGFEECDPAHPDYSESTCDPSTCQIIQPSCTDIALSYEVLPACSPETLLTITGDGIGYDQLYFSVSTTTPGYTPQNHIYEAFDTIGGGVDSYVFELLNQNDFIGDVLLSVVVEGEDLTCTEDIVVEFAGPTLDATVVSSPLCEENEVTINVSEDTAFYEVIVYEEGTSTEVTQGFIDPGESSISFTSLPAGQYEVEITNDDINECTTRVNFTVPDQACCLDVEIASIQQNGNLFCSEETDLTLELLGVNYEQAIPITVYRTQDPSLDRAMRDSKEVFIDGVAAGQSVYVDIMNLGPGERTFAVQRTGDDEDCLGYGTYTIQADVEFALSSDPALCDEINEGSITVQDLDDNESYTITVDGQTYQVQDVQEYLISGLNSETYEVTVENNASAFCVSTQSITVGEVPCVCGDESFNPQTDSNSNTTCNYGQDGLPQDSCSIPPGASTCEYCTPTCETVTVFVDPECGDPDFDPAEDNDPTTDCSPPEEVCDPGYGVNVVPICNYCNDICSLTTVVGSTCGDGTIDDGTDGTVDYGEECEIGVDGYTSETCVACEIQTMPVCGSNYNGQFVYDDLSDGILGNALTEMTDGLCDVGFVVPGSLQFDTQNDQWSRICESSDGIVTSDPVCTAFALYCGDDFLTEPALYAGSDEQCDQGDQNGVVPSVGYGEDPVQYCSDSCQLIEVVPPFCGDGEYDNPSQVPGSDEQCDGIDQGVCSTNQSCNQQCQCSDNPVDAICGMQNAVYDFDNQGDYFDEFGTVGLQLCAAGVFDASTLSYNPVSHTRTYQCISTNGGEASAVCGIEERRCGDDSINGNERCDDGELDYDADGKININPTSPPTVAYNQSITFCTNVCENITIQGGSCGDGVVQQAYESCDNGSFNDGVTQIGDTVCDQNCQIVEEVVCIRVQGDFEVSNDDNGEEQVGISYECEGGGTDIYEVVLKDTLSGGGGNMLVSNTPTGVFYADFITLQGDYWLECYVGEDRITSNLCSDDIYGTPLVPVCEELTTVVEEGEPGTITFSCEGENGEYRVDLYDTQTQELLTTRFGEAGEVFSGSFEGLEAGEYRVECYVGGETAGSCIQNELIEEEEEEVYACEQLRIETGVMYTSLPAVVEYNCRGQPSPVDEDGFEVRVLDSNGNAIPVTDANGNTVTVLKDQVGSFILEEEGEFVVSCEYQGEGSQACEADISVTLPEEEAVCEELTTVVEEGEPGTITFSCEGENGEYRVDLYDTQTQELLTTRFGEAGEVFSGSFEGLEAGEYRVECYVGGETAGSCIQNELIEEEEEEVYACEQLRIETGVMYTSLPAVVEYNCRGQPSPVDEDGFEVRVLDSNGNAIPVTDANGNTVTVLKDQVGSFILEEEGEFVVSCEYQGEGSQACEADISVTLPEEEAVCEELTTVVEEGEPGTITFSCEGENGEYRVDLYDTQTQELLTTRFGEAGEVFSGSFEGLEAGEYRVECYVGGETAGSCIQNELIEEEEEEVYACEQLRIETGVMYTSLPAVVEYNCRGQPSPVDEDGFEVRVLDSNGNAIPVTDANGNTVTVLKDQVGSFILEEEGEFVVSCEYQGEGSQACEADISVTLPEEEAVCEELTTVVEEGEPGTITFSCEGENGEYRVDLYDTQTQELLTTRFGEAGEVFSGSFEGLEAGEYRVECYVGGETAGSCIQNELIEEEEEEVYACEQLRIETGVMYTSLPAVVEYNCRGQPSPVDEDGFEVRVLDSNGNAIPVTDANGNTVTVLKDQVGSFILEEEGEFVVSCEYQGEGSQACEADISVTLPEEEAVCEELTTVVEEGEPGTITFSCEGENGEYRVDLYDTQTQELLTTRFGEAGEVFSGSFEGLEAGEYRVECYVGGETAGSCIQNELIEEEEEEILCERVEGEFVTRKNENGEEEVGIRYECEAVGTEVYEVVLKDTEGNMVVSASGSGEFYGEFITLDGNYWLECYVGDERVTSNACSDDIYGMQLEAYCSELTTQVVIGETPGQIDFSCEGAVGTYSVQLIDTTTNVVLDTKVGPAGTSFSGTFDELIDGSYSIECSVGEQSSVSCKQRHEINQEPGPVQCEQLRIETGVMYTSLPAVVEYNCRGQPSPVDEDGFEVRVLDGNGNAISVTDEDGNTVTVLNEQYGSFVLTQEGTFTVSCEYQGVGSEYCEVPIHIEKPQVESICNELLVSDHRFELGSSVELTCIGEGQVFELLVADQYGQEVFNETANESFASSFIPTDVGTYDVVCLVDGNSNQLCSEKYEQRVREKTTHTIQGISWNLLVPTEISSTQASLYMSPFQKELRMLQTQTAYETNRSCDDTCRGRIVVESMDPPPVGSTCDITQIPETATIAIGDSIVAVTPRCSTTGLNDVSFDCGGGIRQGEQCIFELPGSYTIACTQDGTPIRGCKETVRVTVQEPPEENKECILRYTPEDKIIENTVHSLDIVCDTQGYTEVGVLCNDEIVNESRYTCMIAGAGSYSIGCVSDHELITGCQDIITLKQPQQPQRTVCGDGIIQLPNDQGIIEECDDGNIVSGDGCSGLCAIETTPGRRGSGRRSSINSFCGDGVINVGEFCDAGSSNGTSASVCSSRCDISVLPMPTPTPEQITSQTITGEPPKCSYIDPPSIQAGELLPFWRGIQGGKRGGGCSEMEDAGNIDTLSMYCTFERIAPNGSASTFTRGCTQQDIKQMNWYEDFIKDYPIRVVNGGASVLDTREFAFAQYGEYRIQLVSIDYQICEVEETIRTDSLGNQVVEYAIGFVDETYSGRICQMNVPVTTPYYLNKGTGLTSTRDDKKVLDSFADVAGNILTPQVQDSLTLQVAQSQAFEEITQRVKNAIPLATELVGGQVFGATESLLKAAASEIYVLRQNMTIKGDRVYDSSPKVLIVDGDYDVMIQGSLSSNIMIVAPEGNIIFDSVSCDTRESVNGIFIAKRIGTSRSLANISKNAYEWCLGGGLTVHGILVPEDSRSIPYLTQSRRSTLDSWFEAGSNITQQVFEGASLRVDSSTIKRTSLPPLASDILETLKISKN